MSGLEQERHSDENIEAAISALMDFFAAEWGGSKGITHYEAAAVVRLILRAASDKPELAHDANT